MEKTARRNIMAIHKDWRIFRQILKCDLALDRTSGRRRMELSSRVDKIARPLSFPNCRHGDGRGCHGDVLCSDHHCDAAGGRNK